MKNKSKLFIGILFVGLLSANVFFSKEKSSVFENYSLKSALAQSVVVCNETGSSGGEDCHIFSNCWQVQFQTCYCNSSTYNDFQSQVLEDTCN